MTYEKLCVAIMDADYNVLAYRLYPLGQPDTAFIGRVESRGLRTATFIIRI